ncbi:hypothetical protein [Labrenzia sp. OB1]|uniref:hypothetical protein n=1 Tax=Labrenzia sp. OB1 TaxID=1561204 RepID=UPI0007B25017|nr:hypothetical protein [Labrenzia sp. OB1]KZM49079.1 hypothetical protein OA90_16570 [Labrenzia sp. OB1]
MTAKDAINTALGVSSGDAMYQLRARRPVFVSGAEACRAAVLHPEDDLDLSPDLRHAVAHRAAAFGANAAFLAGYPAPDAPEFQDLAEGGLPSDPGLAALARHTDMIAATPAKASEAHLQDLLSAGFSVSQIIALSELLAQVCFEMRVVHGLSLLRNNANA